MDRIGRVGDLKLRSLYRKGYGNLQRNDQRLKGMYRFVQSMVYQTSKVRRKLVHAFGQPDLLLSIQPEVNVLAQQFKTWFRVPFHTMVIDLAIHGLWVNRDIDRYYVANEPLQRELLNYGVPECRVTVAGMPLRDGFAMVSRMSVRDVRRRLGLVPGLHTVLLIGGLLGRMLDFDAAMKAISSLNMPVQILAIFGKNEAALIRAHDFKSVYKHPIHLYRTVDNMHELMWASDIVVSKPGSVTMAEVLSLGKPLVAINPLAGSAQELRFAQFMEEEDAGCWIKDAKELGPVLSRIFRDRSSYVRMSRNARRLGRYGLTANQTILEHIKRNLDNQEAK